MRQPRVLGIVRLKLGGYSGIPGGHVGRAHQSKSGAEVLSTYEDGAIILETDGKNLRYTGFKSGKKGEVTF